MNTDSVLQPDQQSAGTELRCFHCGQAVPSGVALAVRMDGRARPVCCAGCQAVAQAIIDGGLTDYYRRREAFPEAAGVDFSAPLKELGLYDNKDFQSSFVRPVADGEREADLILEGISCAACVWLNERHLRALHGVTAIHVNYATRRARVRWREDQLQLSAILAAVGAIGYRAYPFDPDRFELSARRERRSALMRLLVAALGMMQVMMYAYPAYIAKDGDMGPAVVAIMRWASCVLTLPVVLYSAAPFFRRAWLGLLRAQVGMDLPVALGVGLSFVASLWTTMTGRGEVYFDSVTMFVFFLLGARYLELLARQHAARGSDALGRVVPQFARLVDEFGKVGEQVPVSSLSGGDCVLIRPGEMIVVDGEVVSGESEVDESWLTGESRPVFKQVGQPVLSGSLNASGSLVVLVTQTGDATRFAFIRRLIERAEEDKPAVVALADRVAVWFTWVLLILAGLSALWWWRTDPLLALPVLVSVLVVSCPCALSLATPISLTVATQLLASRGVLVTRSHAIENLAKTDMFVFDKTGTLTEARLQLADVSCAPGFLQTDVLPIAAALEAHSEHPIARALSGLDHHVESASDVQVFPGRGLLGRVGKQSFILGKLAFVAERVGRPLPESLLGDDGKRISVFLASEEAWLARFSLADRLRPEARYVCDAIHSAGCRVSILSGDSDPVVQNVAEELGVHEAHGGLLPEEKQARMKTYQGSGHVVAMVGDGVNDAPVIVQAHVSLAMAGGAELARVHADILLLENDLRRVVWARRVAVLTMGIIRQNLYWALAYNLSAIPAAMMGLVPPWFAGLGMGGSSLLVVLNALRIKQKGDRLWKVVSTS